MTIALNATTEALLQREADRQGRPANIVADDLLARALTEAEREFEETVAGIERGLRSGDEGRERPVAEYASEVADRRKARGSAAHG